MTHLPNAWAVFDDSGGAASRYEAQRIVRVTEQKVITREGSYRERHHYKDKVLMIDTEERCLRLRERLRSSAALMSDEQRGSTKRHRDRVLRIVSEVANGAPA